MNKKTKIIIAGICIIALLAVGAAVAMFVMLMNKEDDTPQNNGVYTMDEGNYQQIMDDMGEQVQDGYFETYMTTDWIFPDGSSEATDALLGNSPNNVKPIRCEEKSCSLQELFLSVHRFHLLNWMWIWRQEYMMPPV